jgi:hypothetical protein
MEQFKGYTQWPEELREVAKERLLHGYFDEHIIVSESKEDYIEQLKQTIEEDLEFYERFEEYEICQILKDLNDEIKI